ncbi:MAG: hypothetical protein ABI016_05605 [Chthoniobacterales bacterium]
MKFFRYQSFQLLCAFFALFVVAGDLVADSLHDASGACASESQGGDHASCPACGCSLHVGAALGFDRATAFLPNEIATAIAELSPIRSLAPPAEIDHPPQLS